MAEANQEERLSAIYQKFRLVGIELEEFIDDNTKLDQMTELELHRLDKTSAVLKMGFKTIKQILRKRGITKLKTIAKSNLVCKLTSEIE